MEIHGLNKTTLLDYPGKVGATMFTGACNFCCPFCHNAGLVLHPQSEPTISSEEIERFLERRKGITDGICITGGEPTLQKDLKEFILHIKEFGYLVKLDTNGYRPDVLRELLDEKLLDYVAMDIKSSKEGYALSCGIENVDIRKIEESVAILLSCDVEYEFRTTVVKGIHSKEDFVGISKWIAGAKRYFLQQYKEEEGIEIICPGFSSFTKEEMKEFEGIVAPQVKECGIRGID